jgi:hypothetical protein
VEALIPLLNELAKLSPYALIGLGGLTVGYAFYKRRIRPESEFLEQKAAYEQRIKELRDEFTGRLLAAEGDTDELLKLHDAQVLRQERIATALEAILGVKMPK